MNMMKIAGWSLAAMLVTSGMVLAQTAEPKPLKVISSLPSAGAAVTFTVPLRGFDKAHGLAVDIAQSGGSSTLQIDAVLAGSVMFGHPGTATALQAIREGADIKILGAIAKNQMVAVISNEALKKSGISLTAPIAEKIKALKGMTIGTNPVGSTYTQMLVHYLKQYGLDPDKDVRLVGLTDSTALITGMEQGRFDAIISASGVVEQALSLKAGQILFSGARGDIPGGESSVIVVIVARSDTVEKYPELVKAYRAAMSDSLKAVNEDHAETGRLLRDKYFSKMDEKVWEAVWNNAVEAFPEELTFGKSAFDFWVGIDPKGPDSFKAIDYRKITIPEAQAE
ncbi:ABC transporter substrate-binding protein [Rhizobium sp. CF142]|uniref:ABC transporter substrate-binding protein n=1 Tax=Rhizobium sp. CF142 TaxID=1144314 RepID=UPI00026F050A|nr:ABC transporter substrate-binding protein [Rhizobium sp. CF142]EJJ25579.1 ABC-type nitrate/sulfonate/bicarbonate transport system, periplasmic component [Rhizobium sp. CF142]